MRTDVHHIKRAEVLAAQVMTALIDRAMDIRVLTFVHGIDSFRICIMRHSSLVQAVSFTLYDDTDKIYIQTSIYMIPTYFHAFSTIILKS